MVLLLEPKRRRKPNIPWVRQWVQLQRDRNQVVIGKRHTWIHLSNLILWTLDETCKPLRCGLFARRLGYRRYLNALLLLATALRPK